MADFSNIIQKINDNINTNGVGAITGEKLNEVLRDMIAAVNAEKQDPLTIDATPTEDSTNPVQSGGVYEALNTLIPRSSLFGGFITDAATPNPEDSRRYFLTLLDGELPNFEIYDLPDNGKWKIVRWNPRDAAWDWETIDSYTSAQIDQLLSAVAAAISGKQDPIPVVDASTIPASMDSDKVYQYGTLSGDTTFPALNTPTDLTVAHVYCWTFTTPATAPTITWPSAITSWAGGSAPTINASKSYEVSVMDGFATIIEN